MIYDDQGQLLTGSFADYLMPTAFRFPISLDHAGAEAVPEQSAGCEGRGRGRLIPSGGIMANAIADALSHLNVQPKELPCRRRRSGNWWKMPKPRNSASVTMVKQRLPAETGAIMLHVLVISTVIGR